MDFDFPLIPLLPLPITLVPASTFAALDKASQQQFPPGFASSVSIGISTKNNGGNNTNVNSASSSFSSSSIASSDRDCPSYNGSPTNKSENGTASSYLSDQERLGAIVDALGEASAKAQELPSSITQRVGLAKNPNQRVYILRTGLDSGEDQWLDQLEIGSPLMQESIRKSIIDKNESIGGESSNASATTYTNNRNIIPDLLSSWSVSPPPQQQQQQDETFLTSSSRLRSEEKGVYVAGMLKMGEKKLFIVDKSGILHEQEVCCVLDFYVDETCQRRGFGKLLFDYMIKVEGIDPCQIAYDRPSRKLYQFLSKHFQLERHLPQPNQFAVFEGFNLLDTGESIKVDDSTYLAAMAARSSLLGTTSQQQSPSQQQEQQERQPQADTTNFIPSQVFSAPSRALQSSVTFGSGYAHDSQPYTTTTTEVFQAPSSQQQQSQQPNNKRISSAFTSSISLTSPTPPSQNPSGHQGSVSGTGRISRLLASSIVFTDPTGGSA
ncbi:Alpha-tubulin N-acetyltransferase 1 [Linnemannia zychae]|nr:Alpha-tubulin N-acetyltransferase 1 [Linnemannia zychae]